MTTTELLAKKYAEIFSKEYDNILDEKYKAIPRNIKGNEYSGCNIFFLEKYSRLKGFNLPVFMTFNQIKEKNLFITKGEQSCPVVYYDVMYINEKTKKRLSESEYLELPENERDGFFSKATIKYYNVFNVCQTNMKTVLPEVYDELLSETLSGIRKSNIKRDAIIYGVDRNIDNVLKSYPDKDLFLDKHEWYRKIFNIVASSENYDIELSPYLASSIVMTKIGFTDQIDKVDMSYMKLLSTSPTDAFNAVTEASRLANHVLKTFNIVC